MEMTLTYFDFAPAETDKNDKTDLVSNQAFLQIVFGEELDDVRPIVVSFSGSPTGVDNKSWFGRPWHAETEADLQKPDRNNYFSLAMFRPDETGSYRRQKSRFVALCAVMLDDIGIKVAMDRLTLKPSWLLETSPGNHQAGYVLSEPLTDGNLADRLMNAIVSAGLCDPGANGPRARLARLPVAINGKHTPPFRCRMVSWLPEKRYSVEELVEGLQLEIAPAGRPKRQPRRQADWQSQQEELIWIPRPEENQVIAALGERGLYKTPLGGGKHDISCPWVEEHTDAIDGGTAYFEPDDSWPIGGFKCLHGHCAERHIRDLLRVLDIDISSARMKPIIRIVAGEFHRVVDAAEHELAQSGRHYQRGGLIVCVATDPGTGETKVQEVSQAALVPALAGAAIWERFDGRAQDWVRVDPPARHVTVLYDMSNYRYLPVLNGIARQPYLRPDGSLMTQAGYDAATGMFGVFSERKFSVPEQPTRKDAEMALGLLKDLIEEFSFAKESDRAAALSAILTAAIRPSLSHAPMFHVRAHMVGSGKSYLCELISAFAMPQRTTPTTFPADDEECRKLLLAELMRAPAVLEFDNLTGDLVAHKSLCTALTSEFLTGRILGVSKTATVSTRTLFLSSGNNVGPVQDMSRRCITIHLDPGVEIPATRTFKRPGLVREVLCQRSLYVSAVLTIVRAWIMASRPHTECRALVSYGDWSDLCRQPLLWLGCADPTISVFEAMQEDPDRETLNRLLSAWHSVFRSTPTMIREAIKQADLSFEDHQELREVLHDIASERGEINRRKLGWWIRRHAGRIVNGLKFVRATGNSSSEKWRVESVLPVSSVSSSPILKTVTHTQGDNAYFRASRGE
jgi:hypothetical protein